MQSGKAAIYNNETKMDYVVYESENPATLVYYFTRFAEKEHLYRKDILEMNIDELKDTVQSMKIRRSDSRTRLLGVLRGYADWVKTTEENSGLKVTDAVYNIKPEDIDAIKINAASMIKSPEHLDKILNSHLDYEGCRNRARQYALFCWLLYTGLTMEEIQMLKKDAIDSEGKTINAGGKVYGFGHIECPLEYLWDYCAKMETIEKKSAPEIEVAAAKKKKLRATEPKVFQLVKSEYLLRPVMWKKRDMEAQGYVPYETLILTMKNIFSMRVIAGVNPEENIASRREIEEITPNNIRLSGMYYKLYSKEKNGEELTKQLLTEILGLKYAKEMRDDTVKKYKADYANWKSAFNLE